MAARTEWAGTLALGLVKLPLEGVKATKKYEGNEPIKELCACHNEPTNKRRRCSVTGDEGAAVVSGTQRADGTWALISEADLEAIKAETESGELTLLAYEPVENVALNSAADLFWLRLPKKQPGYDEAFEAFKRVLGEDGRALIGKIVRRQREVTVAIYAEGDKLCMSSLRYSQELHAPEADVTARSELKNPASVEQLRALLQAQELPEGFDISTVADESVTRKQAAVARAVEGESAPVATTEVEPSEPAPDLMATLTAAVEQAEATRKKPARKPATKAKVKA